MKCRKFGASVVALAAALACGARIASADPSNPVQPTVAQVQALVDATDGFHSNQQLSEINSITPTATGISVDVTFRVGVGTADPFDPNFGQNFARVTLQALPSPHLDWSAFQWAQVGCE